MKILILGASSIYFAPQTKDPKMIKIVNRLRGHIAFESGANLQPDKKNLKIILNVQEDLSEETAFVWHNVLKNSNTASSFNFYFEVSSERLETGRHHTFNTSDSRRCVL